MMMRQPRPKVFITKNPIVVFMVPSENSGIYAALTDQLTASVQEYLEWGPESIELIGLIAATAEHGAEGIFFLEEMGVNTRSIALLVLWAETAKSVNFNNSVSEYCGTGTVILPETGVVLPTVRMPSGRGEWWSDSEHYSYAVSTYAGLIQNGLSEMDGTEPHSFITGSNTWN